jgi:putative superfamily III holin-X
MNTNGQSLKEPTVAKSVAGLAHDAIQLAELQTELLMHDLRESGQRTRTSLVCGMIGMCLLLGSLPVILIALAELLAGQLGWPQSAAYAAAAVVGMAISATAFAMAYSRFKQGIFTLENSREELTRNIEWMKLQLSKSRKYR